MWVINIFVFRNRSIYLIEIVKVTKREDASEDRKCYVKN